MTILITGGAGFIGANFVRAWVVESEEPIVNLDALTYAGNPRSLEHLARHDTHLLVHGDIGDRALVDRLLQQHRPRAIVNFAAESHVDRSILGPEAFLRTNIHGTFTLLEAARAYWSSLDTKDRTAFRFLHVSTDEVYGSLDRDDPPFSECNPHRPNSPYAASKASSDHLVRAWHHTYGLPVLTSNCSNNYGPLQFPEKLIPLLISNAIAGQPLPIYGDGLNIRDWLYVEDHCTALRRVLERGAVGETYNIGGDQERTNIEIAHTVCDILDQRAPREHGSYRDLIRFVADRPGHDRRYAIDARKIKRELGWSPAESFESGINKTVDWYLANRDWVEDVRSGAYREWTAMNYGHRIAGGVR